MRKLLVVVLVATIFIPQPAATSSSLKVGNKCSKINQIQKSGSSILVCDSKKGKVWRKATSAERFSYQNQLAAKAAAEEKNPFAPGISKAAADKAAADKAAADKAAADKAAADKAAAADALNKTCVVGGSCTVGNFGPGGGIVFYDAGSEQPWGRYLEFAPKGWSKANQDNFAWCNLTNFYLSATVTDSILKASLGREIGKGKANTNLMLAGCTSGAAVQAQGYRGGGKSDWFLPSWDELNELCKFASYEATGDPKIRCRGSHFNVAGVRGDFESYYWSSSEINANFAWSTDFRYGGRLDSLKVNAPYVRPVRAF